MISLKKDIKIKVWTTVYNKIYDGAWLEICGKVYDKPWLEIWNKVWKKVYYKVQRNLKWKA